MNSNILLSILPVFWPNMPPLGLAYLSEYLSNKNIEVDILDLNNIFYNLADNDLKKSWLISCNKNLEKNILKIINEKYSKKNKYYIDKMLEYDVLGFSCFKSNLHATLEFVKTLKSIKKNIKVILGGPEMARQYFKTAGMFDNKILESADLIVIGEGEKALHEYLCGEIENKKILKFMELQNLGSLPFPKFNKISLNSYPVKKAVNLQFSRGCIRKCRFCSEKLLHEKFRTRPVEALIDEIKYHRNNGINRFVFFDSMWNADLKKLEFFCDEIVNKFGSINWEAQIAVRKDMDLNLFKKIKKSGCYNLFIGLESGSDNTLKRMNKGFSKKDAKAFFEKLKKAELFFGVSLIVGYPNETEDDFKESLDFVIENKDIIPKIEQINPFIYYDGTKSDADYDYKLNPIGVKRMKIFVEEIKKNNFKYTKAFLGNLMEK